MTAPPPQLRKLVPTEAWLVAGLLFFLPLQEAPKNLLWLAFGVLWIARSLAFGAGWGGPWRTDRDLPFLALTAAGLLTCWLASPFPQMWREFGDIVRYALFGWLLARSSIDDRQVVLLSVAVLSGTLIGSIEGWWAWQIAGEKPHFELNSVGHTNHSAIYLAISTLIGIGFLVTLWQRLQSPVRLALLLALVFQSWLLTTGESRGGLLTYLTGLVVLIALLPIGRWRWFALASCIAFVSSALLFDPYLIEKTRQQVWAPAIATNAQPTSSPSSYRIELANTAMEAFRQHPLTGLGPGNFRQADPEQTRAWLSERGATYSPERYFHSSHAHSLYFNTLAERGLLGIIALATLFLVWARTLIAHRRRSTALHDRRVLHWSVGLAGFIGVFVAGIFNTSLHHEHGLLAMFALGLLMGRRMEQIEVAAAGHAGTA